MQKASKLTLNQETLRMLNPDDRKPHFGTYVNCCTCFLSCPECNPPQHRYSTMSSGRARGPEETSHL